MRILFLAHRAPYPPNKGDKIRSSWELETLSAQHEVDLLCFYDSLQDARDLEVAKRYCRYVYAEHLPWFRSRFYAFLAFLFGRPLTLGYFYSHSLARRVRELVKERDYGAITVFCSSMAQYIEAISGIPRIIDMVDVDSDKWEQYARRLAWPAAWLWQSEARRLAGYEEQVIKTVELTLVCTDAEASLLRKKCSSAAIETLAHRVDTVYFDPGKVAVSAEIRAWQPYVILTGWMDYLPNADAAEYFYKEIFPWVLRELPDLRFVIAGGKPGASVRRMGTDPRVCVTGFVPDVRPYLRGAAAAVAPLRIARGLQNKILEAMSMGLPVVATGRATTGMPDAIASLMVTADDPRQFAARLVHQIRAQQVPPLPAMRRAVEQYFGTSALETRLHTLLSRALGTAARNRAPETLRAALVPSSRAHS